jgi:hypothetical protein
MKNPNSGLCLHPWHSLETPFAFVSDWRKRLAEIETKEEPPESVSWRKRLFGKPIDPALLPPLTAERVAACEKAWAAYDEAKATLGKAYAAYKYADRTTYDSSWAACADSILELTAALIAEAPALSELHRKLCVPDCPWRKRPGQEKGTIFLGYETYMEMTEAV